MESLENLSRLIRHAILTSTTTAGSGHPSSSLSAVELMSTLFFGGFLRYFSDYPEHPNNDRVIFSKGHAAPLLYALWAVAGAIEMSELETLRKFGSRLEGHPTPNFPFTEATTGSLGQGLAIGVGMAINAQYLDKLPYKTYVLLGDSEMAEGSNWEALQLASHYKLNNLVGILDVNRLGQRGETMYGHQVSEYENKIQAFGWDTITVDGHNLAEVSEAFSGLSQQKKPVMIIAKTLKGKGVSIMEDKEGWHGKVLDAEQLTAALKELGDVDLNLRGEIAEPEDLSPAAYSPVKITVDENYTEPLATRKAYGHALVKMHPQIPEMVVLDAEVSNSTYSEEFKNAYPDRFFEMFIAEQNMVGVAVGLAARGKVPFVSTFASFFTRAADQLRMAAYARSPINCIGSHCGVSIGQDGASQMGLEDISFFRSLMGSVVVYPADHVSEEKIAPLLADSADICYIRTTRADTEPIYSLDDEFKLGGSKTLHHSDRDEITVVAAGITLYEVLKAHAELQKEGINIRVIDLYSIKPLDVNTLQTAARETKALITVEDHYPEGGIGDAVREALSDRPVRIYSMAVTKMPHSGTLQELLDYEEISSSHIVQKVKEVIASR